MRINTPAKCTTFTHEGAPSTPLKPIDALRRSVMAHMLWEDSFYEDGIAVGNRIEKLCEQVDELELSSLALEVHQKGLLRHMPLFLVVQLLKKKNNNAAYVIEKVCNRPDQMTELLALYWKDGKKPLAAQLKKGLAKAFVKFDEHRLSKWNRDSKVKLKDVLFMCHPKPLYDNQPDLWKRLIDGTLATADTWETRLSAGEDKKESFEELLTHGKMGLMAMLMNVRNMHDAGVPKHLVAEQMARKTTPMLPFKFLAAAAACPAWEDIIDPVMVASAAKKPKLLGHTYLFVDVTGSMDYPLSTKSQMKRMDAAAAFAILLRECCQEVDILTFSDALGHMPPRHGSALKDAIVHSQPHSGTNLAGALMCFMQNLRGPYDRLIIITDEQINAALPAITAKHKYILNVGNYQNGIGTQGGWLTISGFAEASIDYIMEIEGNEESAPG